MAIGVNAPPVTKTILPTSSGKKPLELPIEIHAGQLRYHEIGEGTSRRFPACTFAFSVHPIRGVRSNRNLGSRRMTGRHSPSVDRDSRDHLAPLHAYSRLTM